MDLILLATTAAFLPLLVPRGPGATAPVDAFAVLFVLACVAVAAIRKRRFELPGAGVIFAVLLVAAVTTAASAFPSAGLLTILIELYLAVLFWCAVNTLKDRPDRMRVVAIAWVGAGLLWTFLLVGGAYHFLPAQIEHLLVSTDSSGRAAAAARNPNLAASYLVTTVFVLFASPWPRHRGPRVAAFCWLFLGVFATGSNGALLGLLAGCGVLAFAALRRRVDTRSGRALTGITLLFVGVMISAAALILPTLNSTTTVDTIAQSQRSGVTAENLGRLNNSVATRSTIWSRALSGSNNNMALGVGPGAAQDITVNGQPLGKSLHNDYLAFFLERGALGLLSLLALVFVLLRWSFDLLRSPPLATLAGSWRPAALGAGICANLVIALTHESLHFRHVWLLFALAYVVRGLRPTPTEHTEPTEPTRTRQEALNASA